MKKIKLSGKIGKDKSTLVDDDDFEFINQFRWHLDSTGYARRGIWNSVKKQNKNIRLHQLLIKVPVGMEIDHINGNRTDNRKINLRVCTHKQNAANQKTQRTSTSKYKGVSFYKNRKNWEAYICTHEKKTRLGYFKSAKEAAKAYNEAARERFGEFAKLNII